MNVLNNIWLALSTPNEELIKLFSIPLLMLIETPLSLALISNMFNIKFDLKQRLIYIFSIGLIGVISSLFISWPYNIVFNYATAFIILYFVLKIGFIKSFIATLFPSIIFNLIGNLLANPYFDFFKISYEEANTIFIYRIPFVLLNYLIVFILILVLKYRKVTLNILEDFDKKTKSIIAINFVFGFITIFLQGILSSKYIDILPIEFTFFNFIFFTCLLLSKFL